ncbi:hypothetical protein FNYG_08097 [Fusarium nygamai]|uniref:Chromo domain-containing protein n=1 Tax=Gibberella nygamai TaxID=42673 RepID=A0A2K0W8C1_GIBNY|nr:hypothetical protein FNYG_08097 [Fusarium nygamai]
MQQPSHHPQPRRPPPKPSPTDPTRSIALLITGPILNIRRSCSLQSGKAVPPPTSPSIVFSKTDCPNLIYTYWHAQGGRDRTTGFKEYHVFKIIRSRPNASRGVEFLVQWVGFRETDATWEPRVKINKIVPLDVKGFNRKESKRREEIKKR